MALNANDTRQAWRPSSAIGSVSTANENPNPPARPSIAVENARAFRRLFDGGDRGDREGRVDERAGEDLQAGQRGQARSEGRGQVGDADADDADEDHAPAADPVGERGGHQRHEHSGARDGQRPAESRVGRVERVGDEARVLSEEAAAEPGDRRRDAAADRSAA